MRALFTATLLALSAVVPAAASLQVFIEKPRTANFVFGSVEFEASVSADEQVVAVEFWVDGQKIAEAIEPPYRLFVEVGHDNVEHEFKVVARTMSGETASSVMVTGTLKVDDLVEVELQQLYVTVTSGSRRVLELERDDFRISDDGKRQEIVTFERGDVPLMATLLLDCSLSMKGERLTAALEGVKTFVTGMKPLDRAMIVLFSDRLLRATEFIEDQAALTAALSGVEASGGTAVNDHLFMALARLEAEQGRRVVVLFSDGADVHSALPMHEVLQKTRSSQALVYWIHLWEAGEEKEIPAYSSSWRNVEANRHEFKTLREAVLESGGRVEIIDDIADLRQAFAGILQELREQYVLGYYPSEDRSDGSWHNVKVRVDRPGLAVRTREGYIDY